MLQGKKIKSHANTGEEKDREIDFAWVYTVATSQLGIEYGQTKRLSFGRWLDMFEEYKKLHNFRMKKSLYKTEETEDEEISTLDAI